MNTHHVVLKQRSIADSYEPEEVSWQCAHSRAVARLTMVLAWPQPDKTKAQCSTESKAICVFGLGVAALFMFAVAFLGVMYATGAVLKTRQSLQHYNQPQVQYSDVWKWQEGHR